MPTIELHSIDRTNAASTWLLNHAVNNTSQFGEDGILAKIFEVLGVERGWCVEAGAWDGKTLSNTYSLMQAGWSGVFIEANSARFPELQKTYGDNTSAHLIQAFVGFGESDNLDRLLETTPIPSTFELLSLDVDGVDYHIWKSLQRYRPRVVVIEFNPTVPNDVLFIQDPDPAINQGCSLQALITLGKDKGYELVCVTFVNGIFVLAEDFAKFHIEDNSIDAMYAAPQAGRIFYGYDSTIFTAGMDRFYWSGRKIDPEDLQVLEPSERVYEDAPKRS